MVSHQVSRSHHFTEGFIQPVSHLQSEEIWHHLQQRVLAVHLSLTCHSPLTINSEVSFVGFMGLLVTKCCTVCLSTLVIFPSFWCMIGQVHLQPQALSVRLIVGPVMPLVGSLRCISLVAVVLCSHNLSHRRCLPLELDGVLHVCSSVSSLCCTWVSWPERDVVHSDTARHRTATSMIESWVPPAVVALAVLHSAQTQRSCCSARCTSTRRAWPGFFPKCVRRLHAPQKLFQIWMSILLPLCLFPLTRVLCRLTRIWLVYWRKWLV